MNTSLRCAPVAQLDRVIGYEPIGREFESLRVRHPLEKFLINVKITGCKKVFLLNGFSLKIALHFA